MLDASTKQVVKSLARYWCDNPFACDTAEGIRQWWLMPIDDVSVEQVTWALAWLCDRGPVERLLAADGRARFRRASGHNDAALRQLAELGELIEVSSREIRNKLALPLCPSSVAFDAPGLAPRADTWAV